MTTIIVLCIVCVLWLAYCYVVLKILDRNKSE